MHRTVCRIFVVLLMSGVAMGCDPAPSDPATDFSFGDWWGGFGLIDGDRLHWTHITATLRADGRGVAGDGLYLTGPEENQISDKAIKISGSFSGKQLRLRLSYGGRRVDCEATYDAEHAAGTSSARIGAPDPRPAARLLRRRHLSAFRLPGRGHRASPECPCERRACPASRPGRSRPGGRAT